MPFKTTKPRTKTNTKPAPKKTKERAKSSKPHGASRQSVATSHGIGDRRKSNLASAPRRTHQIRRWQVVVVAMGIIVVFTTAFYFFFIRPYAYRWQPCYGQEGYGVCLPYGYKVHGLDISHYQGAIDWHQLTQSRLTKFPIHFIFMKATEGGDHLDSTFTRNFDKAYEHGFIRGAYHFYNPNTDPMKQADFFIRTVNLKAGDLPPVLDIEVKGRKETEELQAALKVWLQRIEMHYGVKPIIYASYKFKMKYLNDSVFNSYPYWIAHYYVDSVRYEGKWDFWQHSDIGQVPGIKSDVDLNVYNGALEELLKLRIEN